MYNVVTTIVTIINSILLIFLNGPFRKHIWQVYKSDMLFKIFYILSVIFADIILIAYFSAIFITAI